MRYVGSDLEGNTFFEGSVRTTGRTKRLWEAANNSNENTELSSVEWIAWLRHTRTEAPSMEELQKNQDQRDIMKM